MEKAIIETTMAGGLIITGSGCLGYAYDRHPVCLRWVFAGSGITAIATAWLIAYRGI